MATREKVGFVGTGRMGRPMCGHLVEAGFEVTCFDPAPAAREAVAGLGARVVDSAAAVARAATVTFVMPGYLEEVEEALLGERGLLSAAAPGHLVVVVSTITPEAAQSLAEACAERGVRMIDAPVCQGERGAEEAYLLWLVGGDPADLERARPAMETCGRDIFHLGAVGSGMVGKALNNMLLWAALVADHEAMAISRRYGVDEEKIIPALLLSSGKNWPLEHWSDMHRIPWAHKDMTILLGMADRVGLAAPLSGLLREQVKPLMEQAGIDRSFIR